MDGGSAVVICRNMVSVERETQQEAMLMMSKNYGDKRC